MNLNRYLTLYTAVSMVLTIACSNGAEFAGTSSTRSKNKVSPPPQEPPLDCATNGQNCRGNPDIGATVTEGDGSSQPPNGDITQGGESQSPPDSSAVTDGGEDDPIILSSDPEDPNYDPRTDTTLPTYDPRLDPESPDYDPNFEPDAKEGCDGYCPVSEGSNQNALEENLDKASQN